MRKRECVRVCYYNYHYYYSDYQWTDDLVPVTVEDFDQPVGAAVSVPETVRGVFELIFDRGLIDHIVAERTDTLRQ